MCDKTIIAAPSPYATNRRRQDENVRVIAVADTRPTLCKYWLTTKRVGQSKRHKTNTVVSHLTSIEQLKTTATFSPISLFHLRKIENLSVFTLISKERCVKITDYCVETKQKPRKLVALATPVCCTIRQGGQKSKPLPNFFIVVLLKTSQ